MAHRTAILGNLRDDMCMAWVGTVYWNSWLNGTHKDLAFTYDFLNSVEFWVTFVFAVGDVTLIQK